MFVDKAKIKVKAGDGGNGCCSFRREKFVPKGGPNGGDGGDGGNVVLVADPGEQSLVDLVYNRHFRAKCGEHGRGKDQHGRGGADMYIRIPVGTIVRDAETGIQIVDMSENGMEFIVAKGGRGGRGNIHFLTNANRAPRRCDDGEEGEERELEMELKTIADIGLVGYPNAGKSTLLGLLSHAKPKTAPYPFTTLHPVVGVIEFEDYHRISLADIPGLIEGAHDNVGLGHDFLRHIERTTALVYVLDMAGVDCRLPLDDYHSLRSELNLYQDGLADRPSLILANKMDLPGAEENLAELRKALPDADIAPYSALNGEHPEELKQRLRALLRD